MYVSMYVCMCVYACACIRTCVRACVRVRMMYVTTTTHKYNFLKNVTIGFSHFLIQTMSCSCIRAADRNRYEITTG